MWLAETNSVAIAGTIGLLILLEGLLSADNALVIALLVRHLPEKDRKRALLVGLIGSFTLRFLALLAAKTIIQFWYLQAVGAAYLFYLPTKHFWPKKKLEEGQVHKIKKPLGFWPTVALVEFTDLAFAIDSVLVAVSVSKELWIIYTGAISGVILLRFAAFMLTRLLDHRPGLEHMAYVLVGWVAVKLAMLSIHTASEAYHLGWPVSEMNPVVFWAGTGIIIIGGVFFSKKKPETVDVEN